MNKNSFRRGKAIQLCADFFFFAVLVALDQVTKYAAVRSLKEQSPFIVWDGIFELHYLENRGAAFGMLQNGKVFFVFAAILMMTVIVFVLVKTPLSSKYRAWHILLVPIAAGGIGNMIDRLRLDYVIDFFYFKLIDFPIFNVADIYVTVGVALLIIFMLFVWKEEDLKFISLQIQKNPKQPRKI